MSHTLLVETTLVQETKWQLRTNNTQHATKLRRETSMKLITEGNTSVSNCVLLNSFFEDLESATQGLASWTKAEGL
jgi:hypothetical protein